MNVFSAVKNLFLFRAAQPVAATSMLDADASRKFVPALKKLVPLCSRVPGMRLAFDVREGQVTMVMRWHAEKPEGRALRSLHYVVSSEKGVQEVFGDTTEERKAPKSDSSSPRNLMRQLADFLTARYRFRFNLLYFEYVLCVL